MTSQTSPKDFITAASQVAPTLNRDGAQGAKCNAASNVNALPDDAPSAGPVGNDLVNYYAKKGDYVSAHREGMKQELALFRKELEITRSGLEDAINLAEDWDITCVRLRDQLQVAPPDKREWLKMELNMAESVVINARSTREDWQKNWAEALAHYQPQIARVTAFLAQDTESASARADAAAAAV